MACASVETLLQGLTKGFARATGGLYLLVVGFAGVVATAFAVGAFGGFELSSDLLDASLELLLLRIPIDGLVVE